MTALGIAGIALMGAGALLCVVAALGIIDFPSALARMHASTKAASLGVALIALGAGVAAGNAGLIGVGVLVAVFLFVTAPIAGHLLGRSAYLAGQSGRLWVDHLAGTEAAPLRVATEPRGFSSARWLGLVVVWMLIWRDVSPGTFAGGSLVATVVEIVTGRGGRPRRVHPVGFVRFGMHYLWMVLASNLTVAWEVLTPSNELIREAIVACPLRTRSPASALLIANAVTFAPGTQSVELSEEPMVLYVHLLHFTTVEALQAQVARLEDLVMAAFPEPA
jgi:monovalent cation/proton antiporter MnhG/PhaG subunit